MIDSKTGMAWQYHATKATDDNGVGKFYQIHYVSSKYGSERSLPTNAADASRRDSVNDLNDRYAVTEACEKNNKNPIPNADCYVEYDD